MLKDMVVEVEKRSVIGKNAARRLRRAGKVPGVLYGGSAEPVPLSIDPRSLEQILASMDVRA